MSANRETHPIASLTRTGTVNDNRFKGEAATHNHSETPNFPVSATGSPLPEVEFLLVGIATVSVHAAYNESYLFLVEEAPVRLLEHLIREAYQEDITQDTCRNSGNTLEDEDPTPSKQCQYTMIVRLRGVSYPPRPAIPS